MYIIKYITYCSFFVTLFFLANCQKQQSRGTTNSPFIRPNTKQNFKKKYMPLYNEKYIEKAKYNSRGRSVGEAIENEKYYPEIHNQNVYRSMDGGEHSLLPTSPTNQNMNSTFQTSPTNQNMNSMSSMSPTSQMANGRQQTSRQNFHTSNDEGGKLNRNRSYTPQNFRSYDLYASEKVTDTSSNDESDRLHRNRNYTPQNFRSYDLHASEKVTDTSSNNEGDNTNTHYSNKNPKSITHYSNKNPESITHYSNKNPSSLYSNEHNIHEQSYVTTNLRSNPWRKKSKRIADRSLRSRSYSLLTDPDSSLTSSQNKSNFNSIPNQFPQNSIYKIINKEYGHSSTPGQNKSNFNSVPNQFPQGSMHKIIENELSSSVMYTANEDPILITGINTLNNKENTAGINTFNNRFDDYAINNRLDEYNEKYQLSSAEDNKNLVTYAFENYEDNLNMKPLSFNNKLSRKLRVSKVNYRRKSIKIALNNFSLRS